MLPNTRAPSKVSQSRGPLTVLSGISHPAISNLNKNRVPLPDKGFLYVCRGYIRAFSDYATTGTEHLD